jgi:single-strand DNA-binding protein
MVQLVGRLGQTPTPKYFDNGNVVINVSLAVKRKYHPLERKVRDVKYGAEETDWFNLEIWGKDAEYLAKYVKKGARIGIVGSLAISKWTDKNTGQERTSPKIVVRSLDVLETRAETQLRDKGGAGGGEATGFWSSGNSNPRPPSSNDSNEDKYFE